MIAGGFFGASIKANRIEAYATTMIIAFGPRGMCA